MPAVFQALGAEKTIEIRSLPSRFISHNPESTKKKNWQEFKLDNEIYF